MGPIAPNDWQTFKVKSRAIVPSPESVLKSEKFVRTSAQLFLLLLHVDKVSYVELGKLITLHGQLD